MAELDARDARIAKLEALLEAALERIAHLEEENRQLKERLNLNSSNSSKPPSSDAPGTPRPPKKSTGRHPGGQPGHKKHERRLLPPEAVQHVVELVPKECKGCRRRLVGKYRLSKRLVKDALADMLGVDLSAGSVVNLEGELAEALAPAVDQAREYVQAADTAHADETGWVEGREDGRGKRAWLWLVATSRVVVFHIARSRGGKLARALLGEDFAGFLVSDRWSGYEWHDAGLRQVCWAHLTRDFQGFIDRGGRGGRLGKKLMRERNRFFTWYHRVRDGTMTREDFERRMPEVERLLRRAEVRAEKKTAGMAREILQWEKCLWTLVDVPGLEPTNNFGERCLRHAVMYRKTSFGTQGPEGSRFVERILTAVTTLKLQQRGVLNFLTGTLHAHRRRIPTPSLLPTAEVIQVANAA